MKARVLHRPVIEHTDIYRHNEDNRTPNTKHKGEQAENMIPAPYMHVHLATCLAPQKKIELQPVRLFNNGSPKTDIRPMQVPR